VLRAGGHAQPEGVGVGFPQQAVCGRIRVIPDASDICGHQGEPRLGPQYKHAEPLANRRGDLCWQQQSVCVRRHAPGLCDGEEAALGRAVPSELMMLGPEAEQAIGELALEKRLCVRAFCDNNGKLIQIFDCMRQHRKNSTSLRITTFSL
jgi:hypothetical protein